MDKYIIYLRKSQMDTDFEDTDVRKTLSRHRQILEEFCHQRNLFVDQTLEEVVSGESLSARPQMQKVLELVNTGDYAGVICMDIDRLSRGSAFDTGYIMQVLQTNRCQIVTPSKTYDLSNEQDEQFSDIKFLFSRYELKTITRRLVQGRKASAAEGKYIGSVAPYGYRIVKVDGEKGNTLEPVTGESDVVRMIFEWYVSGSGYNAICHRLNDMGIPSRSGRWHTSSVIGILSNEVYTGMIRYGHEPTVRQIVDGRLVKSRRTSSDYTLSKGRHEALITEDLWNDVKRIQTAKGHDSSRSDRQLQNPFADILLCGHCGSSIRRNIPDKSHPNTKPWFRCSNRNRDCDCRTIPCDTVETAVLKQMRSWLKRYTVKVSANTDESEQLSRQVLEHRLKDLTDQQNRICELLETGVYSINTFERRNRELEQRIEDCRNALDAQKAKSDVPLIPVAQNLLDTYETLTAKEKNLLWKQVLEKVTVYRHGDRVEVKIFPRLPQ